MKYGLGIKLLLSFFVGGIAVLYKFRINPRNNQAEISSIIKVPRPFIFNIVTKADNVPDYFSWVTRLRDVDPRKNLTIGKEYRGTVSMPFLGQHEIRYVVSEFKDGHWVILKPMALTGSYLNTEIVLMLNSINKQETQFYMKLVYHRSSALFQLTLGPFLKWLTDQQLEKISARVKALSMSKWALWQDSSPAAASQSLKNKKKRNSTGASQLLKPVMKHSPQEVVRAGDQLTPVNADADEKRKKKKLEL